MMESARKTMKSSRRRDSLRISEGWLSVVAAATGDAVVDRVRPSIDAWRRVAFGRAHLRYGVPFRDQPGTHDRRHLPDEARSEPVELDAVHFFFRGSPPNADPHCCKHKATAVPRGSE